MLVVLGLAAMLAIDPLEGSFIVLPGVARVAVGASVGKSRYVGLLCWSVVLVAFGVAAMGLVPELDGRHRRPFRTFHLVGAHDSAVSGWMADGTRGTAPVLIESRKNCGRRGKNTAGVKSRCRSPPNAGMG